MKQTLLIRLVVSSVILILTATGCGSKTAAQPTVDVGATVAAQVQATLAASKPTTPATATPAPTVDVGATVAAAIQMTIQAQPTPTPEPTNTPTKAPTATATPTQKASPTDVPSSSTPVPAGTIPTGKWMVRSYNTDDAAVIWINGKLVGATTSDRKDSNWININDYLLPGQDNTAAFASYNGPGGGQWGFGIRRDDISVWGVEQGTGDDWSFAYAQQVAIHPDGTVEALAPDTSVRKPPPGKWYVRAQDIQDIGSILVNGQPVAAFWNQKADWIDITGLLDSTRDNTITFAAWNFEGPYSWDFAIKHDEDIPWAVSNSGGGQTGAVLQQNVVITGDGRVVQVTR